MNPEQIVAYFSNMGVDKTLLAKADPALLSAIYTACRPENSPAPKDREEEGVVAHVNAFSEVFDRAGVSAPEMLSAYRHERRRKPGLTAREYLGARRS